MAKRIRIPSYCQHKTKDQAYVRLNGQFIYLGKFDSEESKAAYNRIIAEWLGRGRVPSATGNSLDGPSVNEVLLAHWRHAENYYVNPDGSPSGELDNIRSAIRPLKEMYGDTPAADFGPVSLKAVRQSMIDSDLCRNVINQRVSCIKRVFKWVVSEELIPPSVLHGLQAVAGLRRGRSAARETEPVRPVPDAYVDAVLPFYPPTLRAMVELHRITGIRSAELCSMQTGMIETSGAVWQYRLPKHKTAHHGHQRMIPLGPRAQEILKPFLKANLAACIFSPAQAQAERYAIMRATRKSKVQPSQKSRKKRTPKRKPGDCYSTRSYYRAVRYGIEKARKAGALAADVRWHPHQLRHSLGTRVRREYGLDAARAMMGHRTLSQADEYAELDANLATEVAAKIG